MSTESEIRKTMINMQKMFEREKGIFEISIYSNFDDYYSEFRKQHGPKEAERLAYLRCQAESK